jgi:hypothetical protein
VEAFLAELCARHDKAESDRGLAGARAAFHQEDMTGYKAADEDVIWTGTTGLGFGR